MLQAGWCFPTCYVSILFHSLINYFLGIRYICSGEVSIFFIIIFKIFKISNHFPFWDFLGFKHKLGNSRYLQLRLLDGHYYILLMQCVLSARAAAYAPGNNLTLTEDEVIFAHVFFEESDKLHSYLSSICGKFGEMNGIIENVMKEKEIGPFCFINFRNEDNFSSANPFPNFFKKKTNLKEFKKFSIIILSLNPERKI